MSKALEAAVKAVGLVEMWDGDQCAIFLTEDEHKRIATAAITEFLDAAAEDESTSLRVETALSGKHWSERAKAAILALKEAVNG